MGIFHFLNVKNGDCSIIQHPSGHVTVVDVYNASQTKDTGPTPLEKALVEVLGVSGNYRQKDLPVNPITYMKDIGVTEVFRFVLTHPDMDHMGGIKDFFREFSPANFWDSDNTCAKDFSEEGSPHDEEDWEFYKALRDGPGQSSPKRLVLHSGQRGKYYNQGEDGSVGGDGLFILAPTPELITGANDSEDFNDASYVLLYRSTGGSIIMAGDSHDATWEHILEQHTADVQDVDLLIAPHHGRKSDRSYSFLDVLKPKLTFFGNANSEHLAYGAWNYRSLPFITNNQANCMVVNTNVKPMELYITNERFAKEVNQNTFFSSQFKAYFCGLIDR